MTIITPEQHEILNSEKGNTDGRAAQIANELWGKIVGTRRTLDEILGAEGGEEDFEDLIALARYFDLAKVEIQALNEWIGQPNRSEEISANLKKQTRILLEDLLARGPNPFNKL